jgi:uncharacterized protein (TIGR02001 family)
MKKAIITASVAAALAAPALGFAQSTPPATHTFTGNAQVASDYRFRGISQTFKLPAFQGGFDYAHASGFYLGNWNSNVSGLVYPNGAGLEMDFYGGYKKSIGDIGLDVGYLYYYYPGARVSTGSGFKKFDNQELYFGATWKFLTAKVSYALSPYFGLNGALATSGYWCDKSAATSGSCSSGSPLPDRGSSRGTLYYDLTAAYEIVPKLTLTGHIGYTDVKNYGELSYTDYKLGATYDLNGWLLGAALIGTDAKKNWYYTTDGGGKTKQTGELGLVLSVGKTF